MAKAAQVFRYASRLSAQQEAEETERLRQLAEAKRLAKQLAKQLAEPTKAELEAKI